MKPGDMLTDNLRLEGELGSGGMGTVWVATNTALGSRVAVKILRAATGSDAPAEEGRRRFEQEARGLAALDHPHLVRVFDYGMTPDGEPFIVMELLTGEDLSTRLKRVGRLDSATTVAVVTQTCRALAKAHAAAVIHRDIKPANIFLLETDDDVFVKVLDFGVAKFMASELQMTKTGALLGTPRYMSPEQFMSPRETDHRSDLYSLAVVAYACLTGRLPFEGDTLAAVGMAASMGVFSPPSEHDPRLPAAVDAWMKRALAPRPGDRFQSAKELAASLREAIEARAAAPGPGGATRPGHEVERAAVADETRDMQRFDRAPEKEAARPPEPAISSPPVGVAAPPPKPRSRGAIAAIAVACGAVGAGGMWLATSRGPAPVAPVASSSLATASEPLSASGATSAPRPPLDTPPPSSASLPSGLVASALTTSSASASSAVRPPPIARSMAPAITPLDPPPDATNLANGLRCARAAQCGSGFCVDGVCCDSACSSRCMACTGQKTGTGALPGSCGFITGGLDPDEECKGPLNRCDGDGGCVTLTREQIGRLTGRPD